MTNLQRLKLIVALAMSAFLGWLAFGYFGVQALVTNKTVNDPLPVLPSSTTQFMGASSSTDNFEPIAEAQPSPSLIFAGNFVQGDSTYSIKGTARIIQEDNQKTLVLQDFDVTNGPDLFVYLVAATSTTNMIVKDRTADGQFVQLAALKGNRGNQSYILPADIDLSRYSIVSIWCRRFSRNFGSALLQPVRL